MLSYPGNIRNLFFSVSWYPGNIGNLSCSISWYPGNIENLFCNTLAVLLPRKKHMEAASLKAFVVAGWVAAWLAGWAAALATRG